MHKTLRLLTLLAFVVGLSAPGMAAEEKKYRFEFFGGASFPIDKDFRVIDPFANQAVAGRHDFSPGARGGVRFGIDWARHWGQEYTYSYGANISRIEIQDLRFSFTNHFHEATSNVLFYPGNLEKNKVHFFLTAGLGAMWVTLNQSAIQDAEILGIGPIRNEVKFSFNAGVGVRFRINERFGIRLDARDYMSPALRYGLPKSSSNPYEVVFPVENTFHQLFGSFSFVIHF